MEQREIKIKLWDNVNKKMSKSFDLLEYINISGDARYYSGKAEAFSGNTKDNSKQWQEDRIIIQYTGIKDKNGNEIYHGDKILVGQEGSNSRRDTEGIPQIVKITPSGVFAGSIHLLEMYGYTNEIVGNIYENP